MNRAQIRNLLSAVLATWGELTVDHFANDQVEWVELRVLPEDVVHPRLGEAAKKLRFNRDEETRFVANAARLLGREVDSLVASVRIARFKLRPAADISRRPSRATNLESASASPTAA